MLRGFFLVAPLAFGAGPDDWAYWRGPAHDGMARGTAPATWSDTANVLWKAAIPGRGFSSPVAWGGKIFVTTAIPARAPEAPSGGQRGAGGGMGSGIEHRFVVMALDRATGKTIWERTATTATPHEGYHQRYGSFASNTPVTDGKYLYTSFGSRGLYTYDLDGKLVWKRTDLPAMRMRNQFGEGAPLTLSGGRLLVKADQESDSFLVAIDAATGKDLWRVNRAEVSSWSPPLVVTHKGVKQVIVSATAKTVAYHFDTGKVLWEVAGLGTNVIPAPVLHDDLVIVMSGHREPNLQAIRLGHAGDLAQQAGAVVWTNQRGNSYTASPVLHEGKLYFITDSGMLSCFDAATGKPFYHQQRLGKPYSFKASPVGADGKLYLASENDDVIVVRMGEKFEVVATNTMAGETFIATPAIVDGKIYLRGQSALYAIGEKRN